MCSRPPSSRRPRVRRNSPCVSPCPRAERARRGAHSVAKVCDLEPRELDRARTAAEWRRERYNSPVRHLVAAVFLLSFQAVQEGPPKEAGPFRTLDLVELTTLDPGSRLDIRDATPNNLASRPVYAEARAF